MPTQPRRRCAFPGCAQTAGRFGRCDHHANRHETARRRLVPTKAAERDPAVRRHRAAAVRQHIRQHGWVCPGDQHHARHPTRDLVADDPVPIARGGDPMQQLAVMCRAANSRKGARC